MAVIETPSSLFQSNARSESIFDRLENAMTNSYQFDGPFDQDYCADVGPVSGAQQKIKTIIFLQDINIITSNTGSFNQFLGL